MAHHQCAPGVFELEIEKLNLEYEPGDCTLLIRDDQIDSRPYSFSSHPDEPTLRFLIRKMEVPNGLSPWLSDLHPGQSLGVGTPFGWFRPGQSDQEVWIATGTGLSPFLSALRAKNPPRPLGLWIGVRSPDEAILKPWLEERVSVSWGFSRQAPTDEKRRYVTDFMEEIPIALGIRYFLCGNQRMAASMTAELIQRGIGMEFIHQELFCP